MDVRRQRAGQRDAVDARLLFVDRPLVALVDLLAVEKLDQLGPLDAAFNLDLSLRLVEADDLIEARHVEVQRVAAELLAAHRVPPAGDADRAAFARGVAHGGLDRVEIRGLHDPMDAGRVQLRLHVVQLDAGGSVGLFGECRRR